MARSVVTVAGAGPAGLAAAIALARKGFLVRVLERARAVGSRFHDDFQGIENWSREQDALDELRGGGVEPTWWMQPLRGGTLYDSARNPVAVAAGRPLFYLVRRGGGKAGSLDLGLLEQAVRAGVEVEFGRRADPAGADIDATGPRGRPFAVARGVTFEAGSGETIVAFLDDALAPGGYAYFLAAAGQATLATVLFRDFARVDFHLDRTIEAAEEVLGLRGIPRGPRWSGRGRFEILTVKTARHPIAAGEAAGFQDPLFGFGIRSAIVSGILAARSLAEGREYADLWRERLLPHLAAGVVNRAAFTALGDLAKVALCVAVGRSGRPERMLRLLYGPTPAHRALYAIAVSVGARPWLLRRRRTRRPPT